jgi:hypothetical protein
VVVTCSPATVVFVKFGNANNAVPVSFVLSYGYLPLILRCYHLNMVLLNPFVFYGCLPEFNVLPVFACILSSKSLIIWRVLVNGCFRLFYLHNGV